MTRPDILPRMFSHSLLLWILAPDADLHLSCPKQKCLHFDG
jgi:hypothetical protein